MNLQAAFPDLHQSQIQRAELLAEQTVANVTSRKERDQLASLLIEKADLLAALSRIEQKVACMAPSQAVSDSEMTRHRICMLRAVAAAYALGDAAREQIKLGEA